MEAESTSTDVSTPKLFLHAQFEVPGEDAGGADTMMDDECPSTSKSITITKHTFDASDCKSAVIGLPEGVEPVKVGHLNSLNMICIILIVFVLYALMLISCVFIIFFVNTQMTLDTARTGRLQLLRNA